MRSNEYAWPAGLRYSQAGLAFILIRKQRIFGFPHKLQVAGSGVNKIFGGRLAAVGDIHFSE
jgi:hypothetical protein